MGHLLRSETSPIGKNIGLVFARNAPIASDFAMVFIADKIIDHSILSTQSSTYGYIAPLYLHSEIDNAWSPNLNPSALAKLTTHMTFAPTPIEIFDYIYGILHDSVYRERFNDFLKRDFPRVPVVNDSADRDSEDAFFVSEDMFRTYVAAGARLRKLHLMQMKAPTTLKIEPNTPDDLEIGAIKYKDGVLHLNANKRILGIPADVWEYRIGGYQVLDKWFKSYKGEMLTIDRYTHIENVVGLLVETIKVQEELQRLHKTSE